MWAEPVVFCCKRTFTFSCEAASEVQNVYALQAFSA